MMIVLMMIMMVIIRMIFIKIMIICATCCVCLIDSAMKSAAKYYNARPFYDTLYNTVIALLGHCIALLGHNIALHDHLVRALH